MAKTHAKAANSDNLKFCPGCKDFYHPRGFATHQSSCLRKAQQHEKDKIFEAKLKDQASEKPAGEYHLICQ